VGRVGEEVVGVGELPAGWGWACEVGVEGGQGELWCWRFDGGGREAECRG
jgi:hypothetical protein